MSVLNQSKIAKLTNRALGYFVKGNGTDTVADKERFSEDFSLLTEELSYYL